MLLFLFLICSVVFLGNSLSETSAALELERILIREENGLEDMTDYSASGLSAENPLYLATANEPEDSGDMFSMTSAVTDPSNIGLGTADYIDGSLDLFNNPLVPIDSKPGDRLAFHADEVPLEGWGDCDFPKTPACCEHTESGVICIWYTLIGTICPDHPDEIWPPRTEAEKAQNRAVCCDQIINQVGIGCVPVHGRVEDDVEEGAMGDDVDDFFPDLINFNGLKFTPIPGACKSMDRRDTQIPTQCLPQKQ